jgi:hypothetical protein
MENRFKYPIYIISKGRFENPITANEFEKAGIDYLIAVEPQEKEEYIKALGKNRVLVLPFSNLGLGSYPARNFCWEHSKLNGYKYHWLFDDNIRGFDKWINGKRQKIENINSALIFVEKLSDNKKIDINGFEYDAFVRTIPNKPFKFNCHVYSAMLIKNELPYRWRLKYNEDVDLCLQVLHNGGSTASCLYYMTNKTSTTSKMKGGNQTELYKGNATEKKILKAKMLEAVWPQYAKTVIRFNRPHHLIDWKVFKKKTPKLHRNE